MIRLRFKQLIITKIDFPFSLNLFENLKSIIISSLLSIDDNQLDFILKSKTFRRIISFKIKGKIFCQSSESNKKREVLPQVLFQRIFDNGRCLETFECSSVLDPNFNYMLDYNSRIFTNICSVSLKAYRLMTAVSFIEYTPNLKSYNLILADSEICSGFNESIDYYKIKLEKFSLKFEIYNHHDDGSIGDRRYYQHDCIMYGSDFNVIMDFIKQFSSSLIYLSLHFNQVIFREIDLEYFNSDRFRREYINPMKQLKKVHFYARLPDYSPDVQDLLLTLKNESWFDRSNILIW